MPTLPDTLAVTENSDKNTKRRGRVENLKPWKPGQTGNPGGRPKGIVSSALSKQLLRRAANGGKSDLDAVVEAIIKTAKKGNTPAFCAIRDTVDGPPKTEGQNTGAQVLIQFIRDPQTPAVQVAVKPEI